MSETAASGPSAHWEHFPHGADIGVRGIAPTIEGAFEQAALALSAIITDPDSLHAESRIDITCSEPDLELLLVDWLNSLIYEMATRSIVFGRFAVRIEGSTLEATAWGEPMDMDAHELSSEPKGATYTALSVRHTAENSWVAECVVDV